DCLPGEFEMKLSRILFGAVLASLPALLCGQMLDPSLLLKPPTNAWPTYNGDYTGRRFSPLTQINQSTIKTLNLAWVHRAMTGEVPGSIVGGLGPAARGGGS